MEKGKHDPAREELLRLIAERFGSDAAFERAAGLAPRTVSNWRRGRSASYLKLLPQLGELLGTRPSDLFILGEEGDAGEAALVRAWRETAHLPPQRRKRIADAVSALIRLYAEEGKE